LKLQLYTGLSREVLQKVIDFEYHVGINGRVSYPGNIIFKQISKHRLYFITTDKMKDQIYLKDLSNYPLIVREKGSATREYIINEFTRRNIPLNNVIESQNPSNIKSMVHLGMGGAFFPNYAIAEEVKEGKFKRIEILDDLFLYIDVIYLKERKKSKTIQSFVGAATGYFFS
jgi:DNA-binding transcriptional LysR family regulator